MRPPSKGRKLCKSPFEALKSLNVLSDEDYDKYSLDLDLPRLIGLIDENLRKNLPTERYVIIEGWRNFTDWITILISLYCLVRATKPKRIVETGIGEIGMTSTFILQGLEDNKMGELYSIDPDKFYLIHGYSVGQGIPDHLKDRQTTVTGPSQKKLQPLLRDKGSIDIFLHDGDHRYKTKYFEFESSYSFLRKDGFILSDDTWDSSFDMFVMKYRLDNYSVRYGGYDYFSFAKK